jgi:hypothetical protein
MLISLPYLNGVSIEDEDIKSWFCLRPEIPLTVLHGASLVRPATAPAHTQPEVRGSFVQVALGLVRGEADFLNRIADEVRVFLLNRAAPAFDTHKRLLPIGDLLVQTGGRFTNLHPDTAARNGVEAVRSFFDEGKTVVNVVTEYTQDEEDVQVTPHVFLQEWQEDAFQSRMRYSASIDESNKNPAR